MKRVLHIYKTYYPFSYGGIEKVIEDLTVPKKGYVFSLMTLGEKNEIRKIKNLKIYYFKKNFEIFSCPFSISFLFKFRKITKNYDIIHFHYPWPLMDLLSLIFIKDQKKILTYHSDIISQKYLSKIIFPITYFFLKSVDQIIATSKNYFKSSKVLKLFKYKVKIIPLGINIKLYKKKFLKKRSISKKKINAEYILFCGTSRNYKGLDILLKAWPKHISWLKLVLAGNIGQEIKNKIQRLDLINQVIVVQKPNENEKASLIKNSLFCILPSNKRSEAFGLFLLEAMFFKKCILSTDLNTGTTFVNKNFKTGLVARPNDYLDLRKKILLLVNNKSKIPFFGKNGFRRLIKLFDSEKNNKKYFSLYNHWYRG